MVESFGPGKQPLSVDLDLAHRTEHVLGSSNHSTTLKTGFPLPGASSK